MAQNQLISEVGILWNQGMNSLLSIQASSASVYGRGLSSTSYPFGLSSCRTRSWLSGCSNLFQMHRYQGLSLQPASSGSR